MSVAETRVPQIVGNFAVAPLATASVLYEVEGTVKTGRRAIYPAVIVTRHGEGLGMCCNWITWLNREPQVQRILADGLDWMLADYGLKTQPVAVFTTVLRQPVRQPSQIQVTCKAFRRKGAEGSVARCEITLRSADGDSACKPVESVQPWSDTDGTMDAIAIGADLPSARLPDGRYHVRSGFEVDGRRWAARDVAVVLDGELQARLTTERALRKQLLAPRLMGTLGDYDAERRTPAGRVNIPRRMKQIMTAHMNMYDWLVWHAPTDWADLHRFLPVAKDSQLKVWVTLCPPSEQRGRCPWSEPYRLDFLKWADAIGKLSGQFDSIAALVIDDYWSVANRSLFTPEYIAKLVGALRSQNPRVAFLPTIYWGTVGDREWMEDYGPIIDGSVFPYAELETGDALAGQLKACREWLGPDKFLLVNVYASGSSGTGEEGRRTAEYMRKVLTVARQMSDGIRVYCLPKNKLLDDHRYAITAGLYGT